MTLETSVAINGITVDLHNEVLRDESGSVVGLRPQSFAVLRHLMARPGGLVTKDELTAAVWPDVAVTDDSLVQCIHEIRRALRDDGHRILKTVPKRGYRILLPANPEAPVRAPTASAALTMRWPSRTSGIALGVAGLMLAAALGWWLVAARWTDDASSTAPPEIAVLPFHNIGGDPQQAYFSDGITEDLITDLSRIPGVVVIARNSVWAYKDKPVPAKVVAQELGVRYLLDGSVRRDGDRVRINAQFIDTASGHLVWADRYEGTLGDVLDLQDEMVAKIVSALAVKLPRAAEPVETRNPKAYDALLLGMERLRFATDEDTRRAIVHFERAAELDPHYGRAFAAIAAAQLKLILSDGYGMAGAELDKAYASVRANLAKAMETPTSLAYTVAAAWALHTGRNKEALALIDSARALAPNDSEVLLNEASILNATGRAEQAEEELRLAMRLDPNFAPATLRALSVALFQEGKYWEAIETVGRIKAQGAATTDDYVTLVSSLGQLGITNGVHDATEQYNALALPAGKEAMSVQEARWHWHRDLFGYHRPYVEKLAQGLRKAGVPEGAGVDLSYDEYGALIHRRDNGEFDVDGVRDLAALTAGTLFDHGVRFVDVRSQIAYAGGHVPGAVNLSLVSNLSKDALMKVAGPHDQIVFYCDGNYCEYSAIGAAKAVLWGYTRVYRLAGGVPAWKDANCPIEVTSNK